MFRAADVVSRPVVASHAVPFCRHAGAQSLNHNLNTTLIGGDAFVTQHGYSQRFLLHNVFLPVLS